MTNKIITSFQQRRQLNQAIEELAEAASEAELSRRARSIVQIYPADLVLTALLKHLDAPNGQVRGGLGHIAALLPPDEVTPALHAAAANRNHSPQARVTAALLLERFLGEELPAGAISDLDESNEVAFQSMTEAIAAARYNRHILLEYVTQMRETDVEVAYMVMEMLERVPPADQIELLRLIAQDDRPPVADHARLRLERLGESEAAGQAAARALYTLRYALPPEQAALIRRSLRKLQFRGLRYAPPAPEHWRSLIGPADAAGNQTVWFVHRRDKAATNILLGFIISGAAGVIQAFASEEMPRVHLPQAREIGELVAIDVGAEAPVVLLETPFDLGRLLLLRALDVHWRGEAVQSLPNEYKLYNDWLWQFADPEVEPALLAYLEEEDDAEQEDEQALDEEMRERLSRAASNLLVHPAMESWILQNRGLLNVTQADPQGGMMAGMDPTTQAMLISRALKQLGQWSESDRLLSTLETSLHSQAVWLYVAGDERNADNARLLAHWMQRLPLAENPLLAALVMAGFGV